jgi:hypothetical protein
MNNPSPRRRRLSFNEKNALNIWSLFSGAIPLPLSSNVNVGGAGFDGDLDQWPERPLAFGAAIKPIDRIGDQVFQDLEDHSLDGAYVYGLLRKIVFDLHVVPFELAFVRVARLANEFFQREDLRALAARDAQRIENPNPLADALHLGLQGGELSPQLFGHFLAL